LSAEPTLRVVCASAAGDDLCDDTQGARHTRPFYASSVTQLGPKIALLDRDRISWRFKMRAPETLLHSSTAVLLACLLACLTPYEHALAAQPGRSILPQLQEQFGLSEPQVRGALGALLVFARDRLPKPEFDELAQSIPNAEHIMQEVKQRGIVTGPLDDIDDYEASLSSLGMGQPLASQFAPAVLKYLGDAGHYHERDILARVLD
jgi:Protein of unknown function VcgC/VcgE (DUF2780)